MDEERELEMELALEELAILFALKDWRYATKLGLVPPDATGLRAMIGRMVEVLDRSDNPNSYTNVGRLYLYKDQDLPSYYCIGIEIGLVPRDRS